MGPTTGTGSAEAAGYDTVELSFSAGGEAVPVGTWRVSRVEEDGTVEAEPLDPLGEPSLDMDARVLLEHEGRSAAGGGGEQKAVAPGKGAKLWIGLRTKPADERNAPGLDPGGGGAGGQGPRGQSGGEGRPGKGRRHPENRPSTCSRRPVKREKRSIAETWG
jgi:hypothetical protein